MPTPNSNPVDSLAEAALLGDDAPVPVLMPAPVSAPPPADTESDEDATPGPKKPAETPAERWRKTIAEAGLTEAKANAILDAFIMASFYHETLSLMGGRVKVTLRTREPENLNRVARAVGALTNPTQQAVYETSALVNLAGALQSFWKKGMAAPIELAFPTGKASPLDAAKLFDQRMDFIMNPDNLGAPVLYVVFQALYQFDRQVSAALSEGASEGF